MSDSIQEDKKENKAETKVGSATEFKRVSFTDFARKMVQTVITPISHEKKSTFPEIKDRFLYLWDQYKIHVENDFGPVICFLCAVAASCYQIIFSLFPDRCFNTI